MADVDSDTPTPQTLEFCELMRTHPDVRATYSGHLHFSHEDVFSQSRRQLVTKACFWEGAAGQIIKSD